MRNKMFDREHFKIITKLHLERYKILKEANNLEEAMRELEQVVTLLSKGILEVFGKSTPSLPQYVKPKLLEGIKNIILEEVLDPKNTITIDKDGFLRIKNT